jgi:hypothetical protein
MIARRESLAGSRRPGRAQYPSEFRGGPTLSHWRPPSLSDSLFFRLKLPSCLTAPLGACRADTVGHRHIMMRLHGVHATPSPGGPCVLRARRPCRLLGLCARAPRPLAPARHAPASHAVSRALLSLTALLLPPSRERRSVPPPPPPSSRSSSPALSLARRSSRALLPLPPPPAPPSLPPPCCSLFRVPSS